jgi:hydroxymethylpyrimidine pyrophosphatase-like HAD family hydrolase
MGSGGVQLVLSDVDGTLRTSGKGAVVASLSSRPGVPTEAIATIGDGDNDTLMFARAMHEIVLPPA